MAHPPAADVLLVTCSKRPMVREQGYHHGVFSALIQIGIARRPHRTRLEFQVQAKRLPAGCRSRRPFSAISFFKAPPPRISGVMRARARPQRLGLKKGAARRRGCKHLLRPNIGDEHAPALAVLPPGPALEAATGPSRNRNAAVMLRLGRAIWPFVQPVRRACTWPDRIPAESIFDGHGRAKVGGGPFPCGGPETVCC